MRSARLVVLGTVLSGIVGLIVVAVAQRNSDAFTLGVAPAASAAVLRGGEQACQGPIDVPEDGEFDRVVLAVGTFSRPGSLLQVTARDMRGRALASGRLAEGYPDIRRRPVHRVGLDRTVRASRIAVCVANRGSRWVAVYGSAGAAARTSTAVKGGRALKGDMSLAFGRPSRSMASLVPQMLARAALFRFPWVGAWAYLVLAALLLTGPWFLLGAVRAAAPPEVTSARDPDER